MSTTINYTNELGNLITVQQTNNIESYKKNTYYNNLLKKVEVYDYNQLQHILYYVDNNESLSFLANEYKHTETTFYINPIISGMYVQFEALTYLNNQIVKKASLVNKNIDLTICYKEVNPVDNTTVSWEKYLYNSDEDLIILFTYKLNGELYSMMDFSKEDGTGERLYNSSEVLNFDWTGLEYYQNGNPVIPI